MSARSLTDLASDAADALTLYCVTVKDAVREVDARNGKRSARLMIPRQRFDAQRALERLANAVPESASGEVDDMAVLLGRDGVASEAWALRVVAIATAAERASRAELPTIPEDA